MIAGEDYVLGERAPLRIEEPADAARVAVVVGASAEAGEAIVAFGGSTLQSLGNAPSRYTLALSLRRLDRVRHYDPRDLTIGLDAGVTLDTVARVLHAARQFIPFDAPRPERATVGGTLAAGWAGPRRAAYGHLRDLLIGSTVALTDGTLATAGGMVVKNVTGYDMSKLYVGSLGTLGIIVRANLKTLPQPSAQRMAIAPLHDDVRERTISALGGLAIEPVALLVIDGFDAPPLPGRADEARLVVLFAGSTAVIERATRDLRLMLGKCGVAETLLLDNEAAATALQQTIDAYIEPRGARSITYRHAGPPATVWQRVRSTTDALREIGARCDTIADLRTGDAILRTTGPSIIATDTTLRAALPTATLLAGDPDLRLRLDAWGAAPATLATQTALKERFDPGRNLAPGRYIGGL